MPPKITKTAQIAQTDESARGERTLMLFILLEAINSLAGKTPGVWESKHGSGAKQLIIDFAKWWFWEDDSYRVGGPDGDEGISIRGVCGVLNVDVDSLREEVRKHGAKEISKRFTRHHPAQAQKKTHSKSYYVRNGRPINKKTVPAQDCFPNIKYVGETHRKLARCADECPADCEYRIKNRCRNYSHDAIQGRGVFWHGSCFFYHMKLIETGGEGIINAKSSAST